jgi:hypothetical protein
MGPQSRIQASQGLLPPSPMQPLQQQRNANYSNIYTRYNNWNVCFSCGFNIKDGHTLQSCPFQKVNHQTGFTCKNVQQFIAAGYDPCTKGMHKLVLPTAQYNWQCGAEILLLANKCKSLVSATLSSLDPALLSKSSYVEDDTTTVIISNCSRNQLPPNTVSQSIFPMAKSSNPHMCVISISQDSQRSW